MGFIAPRIARGAGRAVTVGRSTIATRSTLWPAAISRRAASNATMAPVAAQAERTARLPFQDVRQAVGGHLLDRRRDRLPTKTVGIDGDDRVIGPKSSTIRRTLEWLPLTRSPLKKYSRGRSPPA